MQRALPSLTVLTLCCVIVSCSHDPAEGLSCSWTRVCGLSSDGLDCGLCDDQDACTADSCVDGWCRHVALLDSCSCAPACQDTVTPPPGLQLRQTLTHGQGGLTEPDGLLDLAVSADEQHVYAAARDTGVVAHFLRDTDGGWRFGESHPAGAATAVTLTGDQGQVVVAAPNGLAAFVRDRETGRLVGPTWIGAPAIGVGASNQQVVALDGSQIRLLAPAEHELEVLGSAPSPTLAGARRVALTPDGRWAIVAGLDADVVTAWDLSTGTPTLKGDISGQPGLSRPADVVVAADGQTIYVAGYCDHDIAVLTLESDTGALTWKTSAYAGAPSLGGCVILPNAVDPETPIAQVRPGNPAALGLTPDGTSLWASTPGPGLDLVRFDISGPAPVPAARLSDRPPVDGILNISTQPLDQITDPSQITLPAEHPWSVRVVSGATRTLVSSLWPDAWAVLAEDAAEAFVQRGDGGISWLLGAYNLALSPDGRHLYVAPRLVGTVKPFAVDPEHGGLLELPTPEPPELGPEAGSVSNVIVAPDGTQVFAVDSRYAALLVYDRESATGELTFRQAEPLAQCVGQIPFPVDVGVSPDGTSVLVADFQYGTSCLHVYPRDGAGYLGAATIYDDPVLTGIENVAFTADGKHVYAASYGAGGAAAHLARDPASGELTVLDSPSGGALNGAEFVILSPDETRVFVSSPVSDAVTVFGRDAATGVLAQLHVEQDPDALGGAAGLAISEDGGTLYVAVRERDAINQYAVGPDAKLVLEQVHVAERGLDWVNGLALHPEHGALYSSAVDDSSVSVWLVVPAGKDGCGGDCP
ncbi:MAG: DNA-binding beta-propeller fold protein YncE [Myxococcota bacterium]